jgi:PAS domain S-box-containing protein
MSERPTYEELVKRVRALEKEATERNRAEEAMREMEAGSRALLEAVPYLMFRINRDGTFLNYRGAREDLFVEPEVFLGRNVQDVLPPEVAMLAMKYLKKALDSGETQIYEYRLDLEKGTNHFEARMSRNSEDEVLALIRDITESKEAEQALRESEQRYRRLFNESTDAIYITSRDGQFIDANEALLDLLGYSKQEITDKLNVREIYSDPGDRDRFQREIERKGSVRNYGVKFRTKNGVEIDCLLASSVRSSNEGDILGYQGIIRDVTNQKRAEEALRESEARYRAIVEAFDGFIYTCSRDYRMEFMNGRLIERTGRDATGELCYEALHDLDSICPWCVNEQVLGGDILRLEVLSPKDNRWYYVVNTPIYHGDGSVSKQAMILDITDRKQMEEALKDSSEKIKLFAYSVSHDLKSPAIAVYGMTKRLHKGFAEKLGDKGRDYCGQILRAAEQISALVEQINIYISTTELPLTIERISLKEIIQVIREEFSAQLGIREIVLSEPEYMPHINADRLSLLRVMRNLVDNALKYGGARLSKIRIGYEESRHFHNLSVTDDGVGIKGENYRKIFELFKREGSAKGIEGAGLGLAIVKVIAEQHMGRVWVEPGARRGVIFYISISKSLQPSA